MLIGAEERIEVWDGEKKMQDYDYLVFFGSWAVWQLVERDVKNPFTR